MEVDGEGRKPNTKKLSILRIQLLIYKFQSLYVFSIEIYTFYLCILLEGIQRNVTYPTLNTYQQFIYI